MCGIAGFINLDGQPASPEVLKAMTDAIRHRGPDAEGQLVHGPVAIGHRRLSIIDLSPLGHQPMENRRGDQILSYNGEIYNFRELRAELEALGHVFRSRSDTEVVLAAFEQWGDAAAGRFNGMFAFAHHCRRTRRLTLARDRYGVKPLYYAQVRQTFLFASEVKAFLTHPQFAAELDSDALAEYLTFQNYLTDRTLFRHVRMLPAGSLLHVPYDGPVSKVERYWDFHFCEREDGRDRAELLQELDHLFVQAVSRQLVSDVPVAAYLSGGMDTGSITAVASQQLGTMRSFTVGFDVSSVSGLEIAYDERARAERISSFCGTEHYQMVLKSGDMERAMKSLVWHLEEPRVGQSYPNFYAAKLAGNFDKVVLSGAGGDELFAGYPWRYYRALDNVDFEDYAAKYFAFWQRLLPPDGVEDVLRPLRGRYQSDPFAIFKSVFAHHANRLERPEDYINHSLYFEAKSFLHGLLVVEDKLSMAHSLETRVPFLDNDLVDFAMALPARYKLANLSEAARVNENRPGRKSAHYTTDGKLILREAMARHIPEEITTAAKQGFSGPDASWFRGQSIDYVRSLLLNPRARLYDFLDYKTVQSLVRTHLDGLENRRLLIWSLIYLATWCNEFLGASASAEKPARPVLETVR
jgi:asparagine synthase (glutamine-hydrolysing)